MKLSEYLWIVPFCSFLTGYLCLHLLVKTPALETPSLVGKTLKHAVRLLSDKNLNLRIIREKNEQDLPDGTILNQSPNPGQSIKPNQIVFCVSSQKKPLPITPDCLLKTFEQIRTLCKDFHVKKIPLESKYPRRLCIGQIPAPGTALEQATLHVYVSSGTYTIFLFPQLEGRAVSNVVDFLRHYTITPVLHYVSEKGSHDYRDCRVIAQEPLAGTLVDLSKGINVTLYVQ